MTPTDLLLTDSIADGAFPGASYAVIHKGKVRERFFGRHTYCPESRAVDADTLWDLASLTKVIVSTTLAMRLHERGELDLDQPLQELIPEFEGPGKDAVTFKNLLLHDAGLLPDILNIPNFFDRDTILQAIFAEPLEYETGTKSVYSDLSMILLAEAMARITGEPLEVQAYNQIFRPLHMGQTHFSPCSLVRASGETDPAVCPRTAPTETLDPFRRALRDRRFTPAEQLRLFGADAYLQAEVHDPTAAVMEGVAGHAGLFSTLADLVKFMEALNAHKLVKAQTLEHWTKRQTKLSSRAFGWDTKSEPSSAGTLFGDRSFGHTGYTGTSIWCDPDRHLVAILLTNRVHPTAENDKIRAVRPEFHDRVVSDFGF